MPKPTPPDAGQRRLLIYTHALAGGGAERVAAILASGFAEAGWRVILAVDWEDTANRRFLHPSVAVELLRNGHAASVLSLARVLRRERPHVSLSLMASSNLKHVAAAALAGHLGRTVLSYHAFAESEPQRLSRLGYRLLPILSRLSARTVAVSNGLRANLVAEWGALARRTVTIYNPVLFGSSAARPPTAASDPPMILSAGRLVPDKNMPALVRALGAIASRSDARLVILGEGPDRALIADEASRLGLQSRVALLGYVAEPWALYRDAACVVSASKIESFSMVIVEALAQGVPVVSYDSPGPREVLADGRFGTLVPPGDEAALAEAILQALDHRGDDAARRARAQVFSVAAGIEAYARLFADVAAEVRGAGQRHPAVTVKSG